MRGHGPLNEPEWAQLDAELLRLPTPVPDRRRAWAVVLCGLGAFWAVVGAVVATLIN